jgi:hypothetical protein
MTKRAQQPGSSDCRSWLRQCVSPDGRQCQCPRLPRHRIRSPIWSAWCQVEKDVWNRGAGVRDHTGARTEYRKQRSA